MPISLGLGLDLGAGGNGNGIPAGALFWQPFTAADSATVMPSPVVGSAGSALTGNWGVASNSGYCSTTTGGRYAYRWDAGVADSTLEADITLSATKADCGIWFRLADVSNGYLVNFSRSDVANSVILWRQIAGAYTNRGSWTNGLALGGTYHLKVVSSGATKSVYIDGTLRITDLSASALDTATGVGLDSNPANDTGGGSRFDNLLVTA